MLTSTLPHHLVVIDCETTGLGSNDRIIEIAVLTLDPRTWEPTDEYETLINPERDVGPVGIHGITASMVEAAPTFPEIITTLAHRLHGAILIAHNLSFDARMLGYEFKRLGVDFGRWLRAVHLNIYCNCLQSDLPPDHKRNESADDHQAAYARTGDGMARRCAARAYLSTASRPACRSRYLVSKPHSSVRISSSR